MQGLRTEAARGMIVSIIHDLIMAKLQQCQLNQEMAGAFTLAIQ